MIVNKLLFVCLCIGICYGTSMDTLSNIMSGLPKNADKTIKYENYAALSVILENFGFDMITPNPNCMGLKGQSCFTLKRPVSVRMKVESIGL